GEHGKIGNAEFQLKNYRNCSLDRMNFNYQLQAWD
ncbi:MAG: hypothetical protein ACI90V_010541, partial [Bacillariaceae sp.]